jgi:hypothetical protein
MILEQQHDCDIVIKENKDLDKVNKEENDQNSLNKFIKEDINIDWVVNKENENMGMIECNLINGPKVGIIEGFIKITQEDNI